MPHQCTNCGRAFDDGSKEMLSGCPDCGGNKFQFHPSETEVPDEPESSPEPPDPPGPDSSVARTVGNAAATVRDLVGSSSTGTGPDSTDGPVAGSGGPQPGPSGEQGEPKPGEDTAQADARTEVVSPDEIPPSEGWEPADETGGAQSGVASPQRPEPGGSTPEETPPGDDQPADDRPDLTELREELNDQFESIKVLSPGQYELNLMELYDREEYIIALQEDGRYTIQVPETWHE